MRRRRILVASVGVGLGLVALVGGMIDAWLDATRVRVLDTGQPQESWRVAFSPDGSLLASGGAGPTDGTLLRLWSVPKFTVVQTINVGSGSLDQIAFAPDGAVIALVTFLEVRLVSVATGQVVCTIEGPTRERVGCVAFSPGGKLCATGYHDGTIRLCSAATGACTRTLEGHAGHVYRVAFTPGGETLASCGEDGKVRLWSTATGMLVRTLDASTRTAEDLAIAPAGEVLACVSRYGQIRLWSVATGTLVHTIDASAARSVDVYSVAFTPSGQLLSMSASGRVELWSVVTGELVRTLSGSDRLLDSFALSPQGDWLAVACRGGKIEVFPVGRFLGGR